MTISRLMLLCIPAGIIAMALRANFTEITSPWFSQGEFREGVMFFFLKAGGFLGVCDTSAVALQEVTSTPSGILGAVIGFSVAWITGGFLFLLFMEAWSKAGKPRREND